MKKKKIAKKRKTAVVKKRQEFDCPYCAEPLILENGELETAQRVSWKRDAKDTI